MKKLLITVLFFVSAAGIVNAQTVGTPAVTQSMSVVINNVFDMNLSTGTRGDSNFNIDYKATPGYSYEAGTYSVTLQYTITNQ